MSKQLTASYLSELKAVFDSFDADGNGTLSQDEIANVLRSLGMSPSDEDIASIFMHTDSDLSNSIEFSEFAQWMAEKVDVTCQEDLQEIFRLIDLDGSGAISTDELRRLLESLKIDRNDEEIEALMQQADVDGNGLIEYNEFARSEGLWRRIKLTLGVTRSFYVQAEFDSLAREYNQLIRLWVPWYDESLGITVDSLPSEPSAPHILELGGGTGNLSAAVLERYPEATLHVVDSSSKMIGFCKHRFAKNEAELPAERVHLYEQDFMSLDFSEATFDHVISQFSLHHLAGDSRKQLFQKVHKWLKPGGIFSYSGNFHGINNELTKRYYAQWKKGCYELGATDEQWSHFIDHVQRYDVMDIPIMVIVDWLREIGFVDLDITWRRVLCANLIARKA